jgi:hypothetical protein
LQGKRTSPTALASACFQPPSRSSDHGALILLILLASSYR